jgi:hypothetical protein
VSGQIVVSFSPACEQIVVDEQRRVGECEPPGWIGRIGSIVGLAACAGLTRLLAPPGSARILRAPVPSSSTNTGQGGSRYATQTGQTESTDPCCWVALGQAVAYSAGITTGVINARHSRPSHPNGRYLALVSKRGANVAKACASVPAYPRIAQSRWLSRARIAPSQSEVNQRGFRLSNLI